MRLRNRLLLTATSVIIFSIVSPALILFALGYKFDFSKKTIVKTGTLVARTEPSKADVYLNDEKNKDETPSTIRFLLPGDYIVTIKKDGYQSWTKRLGIQSQVVTWANLDREFLTLFKNEPTVNSTADIQAFYKHPDHQSFIAVLSDGVIHVDNTNRIENLNNYQIWEQLITSGETFGSEAIYNLLALNRPLPLSPTELAAASKIETNNDFTVLLAGQIIQIFDSRNVLIRTIPNSSTFTLDGSNLWLVSNLSLIQIDLRNGFQNTLIDVLPLGQTKIIRGSGNTFLQINNELYILNDDLERIYDNAAYAYWFSRGGVLVYGNNHEFFIFNSGTLRSDLILRSSSELSQPLANMDTGYVFFANEGKIKAIEIDGRDHRNIYTLTNADLSFMVTENGKTLYVIGEKQYKILEIR